MSISRYAYLTRQLSAAHLDAAVVLFFIDVQGMRQINRLSSPRAADALLAEIARNLKQWAGIDGVSGRLWSDEFIVAKLIGHAQDSGEYAIELRQRLCALSYQSQTHASPIAVSIGGVCARAPKNWDTLIAQAADACEAAKHRGQNQICFHGAGVLTTTPRPSMAAVHDFHNWIDAGKLTLYPQPILAIDGPEPRITKAELLLRVERDGVHTPMPAGTIEALEHFGLAVELDRFTTLWALNWLDTNPEVLKRLRGISINLSATSFGDDAFMSRLFDDLRHAQLPRGSVSFEITETAAVGNLDIAADIISDFRTLGCGFSLDDFGSGLCSFGYLHSLPVDEIKIDGRFVRDIAHNPVSQEIIRAIHHVARATGKVTVAEFVDDSRKLEVLKKIGIDYAQGWLFYPAISPEKLLGLLGIGSLQYAQS